jgi:hypothetical protein
VAEDQHGFETDDRPGVSKLGRELEKGDEIAGGLVIVSRPVPATDADADAIKAALDAAQQLDEPPSEEEIASGFIKAVVSFQGKAGEVFVLAESTVVVFGSQLDAVRESEVAQLVEIGAKQLSMLRGYGAGDSHIAVPYPDGEGFSVTVVKTELGEQVTASIVSPDSDDPEEYELTERVVELLDEAAAVRQALAALTREQLGEQLNDPLLDVTEGQRLS